MAKRRTFQIVLTGTVPKGMTVAQARDAYWNDGFGGDKAPHYNTRAIDVDDYLGTCGRTMTVRLGRASLVRR